MVQVLDNIVRKTIFEGPETINATFESPSVSIDGIEEGFSVELKYSNGNSVDMLIYLQYSNDNENFATDADSEVAITDSDGVVLFDVNASATLYLRVYIQVVGGDISLDSIQLAGKRRH